MAGISYAGKSLLIPSDDLLEWLYDAFPLIDGRFFAEPVVRSPHIPRTRRHGPWYNTLYWPTGASRWAQFFGLADDDGYEAIIQQAESDRNQAIIPALILTHTVQHGAAKLRTKIVAKMHLVSPRRLTTHKRRRLWVLPLVDQRYWWQFTNTGSLSVTNSTTWANLFTSLETALGVSITTDAIAGAHQQPDPVACTRQYASVPALLDAACHSIGHRLIAHPSGEVETESFDTADSTLDANQEECSRFILSGSEYSGERWRAPASCNVSFPRIRQFVPRKDGARFEYIVAPADVSLLDLFDTDEVEPLAIKRMDSTAYADFTGGGANPDNDGDLTALADEIASDYYKSIRRVYHWRHAGLVDWIPSAYDDAIYWSVLPDAVVTRVHSAQPNLEIEYLVHQDPQTVFEIHQTGLTDDPIAPGGFGTVSIYTDAGDTGENVEAYYDWSDAGATIPIGTEVHTTFYEDDDKWRIITDQGVTIVSGSTVQWAYTQSNWAANGTDPKVSCKIVTGSPGRSSSTVAGAAFDVYLPRTGSDRDPNVVSGENIPFVFDQDGVRICCGDYLDAKILSIRYWCGDKADIPSGWAVMDGVLNAAGNGGSGIKMVDPAPTGDQYFALPTDVDDGGGDGEVGGTVDKAGVSGAKTQIPDPHLEATLEGLLLDHAIGAVEIDASGIADHAGYDTDSGNADIPAHTLANQASSTGITWDGLSHTYTCSAVSEADDYPATGIEVIDCDSLDEHTDVEIAAAMTDPQHTHVVTGTQTHVDAGHIHGIPTMDHTGTLGSTGALSHDFDGNLTHAAIVTIPPFKNLMMIERLDNSL